MNNMDIIIYEQFMKDECKTEQYDEIPTNEVFYNLGPEKAEELYNQKINEGLSPDDAWLEIYSEECSMDKDEDY